MAVRPLVLICALAGALSAACGLRFVPGFDSMDEFDALAAAFSKRFDAPEILATEVLRRQVAGARVLLVDVRTEAEQSVSVIPGAVLVRPDTELTQVTAVREFLHRYPEGTVVVYCAGGYRSARSIKALRDATNGTVAAVPGPAHNARDMTSSSAPVNSAQLGRVLNLRGGIVAYAGAGGALVDAEGQPTYRVHAYNEYWAGFVRPPFTATTEPPVQ